MKDGKLHVAVAGLRFGGGFPGIYLNHPDVYDVTAVDPDVAKLKEQGEAYGIKNLSTSLDEVLKNPEIDAVHLVTPIPMHAEQTIRVLNAGKHCACTVPAATTLEELHAIVSAERSSGKKYMMMETAVYTRPFLKALELRDSGKIGRVQLLRGFHYQDMENWPDYWMGLPPMWYSTHAVAPCLAFTGKRATSVHAFGSGVMRDELKARYGNPYPSEIGIFRIEGEAAAMEITRTLFQVSREYTEGFCVYGEDMSLEWHYPSEDMFVGHTLQEARSSGRGTAIARDFIQSPNRADILPPEVGRFTLPGKYDDTNTQKSFMAGGGHHGSHPHLVHEFLRSIVEDRKPRVDAVTAADWTAPGICAHESAMQGGKEIIVPSFS